MNSNNNNSNLNTSNPYQQQQQQGMMKGPQVPTFVEPPIVYPQQLRISQQSPMPHNFLPPQQPPMTMMNQTMTATSTHNDATSVIITADDSSVIVTPSSVGRQILIKLKKRILSPISLIASLINLYSIALVFMMIVLLIQNNIYVPSYFHIVFWINFALSLPAMVLKSPILLSCNFVLVLIVTVMNIVAITNAVPGFGFHMLLPLLLKSLIFLGRLIIRYCVKINTANEKEEENQSENIVTRVVNLFKSGKIAIQCNVVDLLVGAD
ncbi:hypothetical protein ABK040_015670 [Willaertia magna]